MDDHGVKAVIFDLGNVLIDFNHMIAAQRVSQFTDKTPAEIFNLFFDSELTALFEEGKISPQEFFLKVKEMLNLRLDYAEFLPIWNEIFFLTEKNYEVYNLAQSLKRQYRFCVISNINILHLEYLRKHFPLLESLPNIITSFEVGARKPHPLIYQKALGVLEVQADEVFYTDDRTELTDGAKVLGIKSFVFKDVEQLKKDLQAAGVNIN